MTSDDELMQLSDNGLHALLKWLKTHIPDGVGRVEKTLVLTRIAALLAQISIIAVKQCGGSRGGQIAIVKALAEQMSVYLTEEGIKDVQILIVDRGR